MLESVSIRHRLQLVKPAAKQAVATPELAVDSRGLLQGRNEVLIRHGNETYRLRHTRNDKLILTK
ncbi:hemin uptake protein HemP [Thermomonas sp. HDW16]|nr:hemin uptake protein HemP [Thermomonas sp. HDW16]